MGMPSGEGPSRESRRGGIYLLMLCSAVVLMGAASNSLSCGAPPPPSPSDCRANLQVGFANINGQYRKQPELNLFSETGPRMRELKLNTAHVWARTDRYLEGTRADQKWGPVASPTDFVKTPFVEEVLALEDLRLVTLGVWAHRGVGQPVDAPSADAAENLTINQLETAQFAELTGYLRTRFKGTGKTFVLKGWETDWLLLNENPPGACLPTANVDKARRMIDWMRAKQQGVNQGRAETADSDVKVYFAVEVNRVQEAMGTSPCTPAGRRLRMAHLLPFIGSDMITYSAWDSMVDPPTEAETRTALGNAVDFLLDDARQFTEMQPLWSGTLPARRPADPQGLGSARLILSEVGVPERVRPASEVPWRLKVSLEVARAKQLKALYFWNLYDNECKVVDGVPTECPGYWLYKPDGSESASLKVFKETVTWCTASSQGKRDIAFVFDLTGSMRDDIDSVKAASIDIVNAVAASSSDYRVAIVGYKDYPDEGEYPYRAFLGFTNDKAAILSAIQALQVDGGGDTPESTLTALMRTLQGQGLGGWREGATKSIIHLTDAPPHDPEVQTGYTSTSVTSQAFAPYVEQPALLSSASAGLSGPRPLASDALNPSVRIFPVVVGGDSATLASSSFFATRTGGRVFTAANAQDVVDAILDAVTAPGSMFRVHGAVGISGSDKKGANRLTRGPCPGQPFMTASALSSTIDVDYNGSRATWNCAEPEYEFGELPFTPGPKTFTFDPPGPYKCEWYAVYGTRDSESFTANPDGTCSVTVGMRAPSELFVWFFVKPIALYKVTGAVGLFGSDMKGANRLTRGLCPGQPFITAAGLGSTIHVTQPDLGGARWNCVEPSFYFGDTLGQGVPLGTGTRSFTFTPPTGYRCNWYAAYGTRTSESFSTSGNACTITLGLSANPGDVFLWYFVQPTSG